MNTSTDTRALDIAGLEVVYDQLACAMDAVGPEKSELLLVKLALLSAHQLGDAPKFGELIGVALRDL